MHRFEALDFVSARSRFGVGRDALCELLPGIEHEIPLISKIGADDAPIAAEGFPVVPSSKLDSFIAEILEREVASHLEDAHYQEDLLSTDAERRLMEEPYVRLLSDRLAKAISAGSLFKFENVIWLLVSERIASGLNGHRNLNALASRDPERYGRIKRGVLKSILARNRIANVAAAQTFRGATGSPWQKLMLAHPFLAMLSDNVLIHTERPDGLDSRADLASIFLVKEYELDEERFGILCEVLESELYDRVENTSRGRSRSSDHFLRQLLRKEPGGTEHWAFHAALRPDVASYLLHHLEARRVPRVLRRQVSDPVALAKLVQGFLKVAKDIVVWDFLNSLRGLLREVRMQGDQAWLLDVPLSPKTVPITLDREHLYNQTRWGTYVLLDVVGFSKRTRTVASQDAALAIQNLFAIRRDRLAEFGGRPEAFEGDSVFEVFDRAIDSIRYVSVFLEHYDELRGFKLGRPGSPAESPFTDGVRVGIGTGESFLISIYQGTDAQGHPQEEFKRIGHVINLTSRLSTGKAGEAFLMGPNETEEPDPLGLSRVSVNRDGRLANEGIVSLESTFVELKDQIRAEGLKYVEPGRSGDGPGPLINQPFALIYRDPIIDRVVLVRRIENRAIFKGFEDVEIRCYEYHVLTEEAFKALRRQDQALRI